MMTRQRQIMQRFGDLADDAVQAACFDELPTEMIDKVEDFCEWLEESLAEVRKTARALEEQQRRWPLLDAAGYPFTSRGPYPPYGTAEEVAHYLLLGSKDIAEYRRGLEELQAYSPDPRKRLRVVGRELDIRFTQEVLAIYEKWIKAAGIDA